VKRPPGRQITGAPERFERQRNQSITCEYGEPLAKRGMDGWFASSQRRIIETGHVVMNQRSTVQQLDCGSGAVGDCRLIVAACSRDAQAESRPDSRAAWKDGVPHSVGQSGGAGRRRPVERDIH
jgi:hypothetical protein